MSAADRDDHWGGLVASVVAGDRGPVVVLSGEADFTSLEQLSV
jgi:hypothetical protein